MRDLKWIVILLVSMLILLWFVHTVTAIDTSTVTPTLPPAIIKAPMGNVTTRTISQMDTVYWGETIDMSLVSGWENAVIHVKTGRVVDVSSFTKHILIDPDVFPVGEWDQWTKTEERAGNLVAFYVEAVKPAVTPNITVNNTTENQTSAVTIIAEDPYRLESVRVSDILVAQGDPLVYTFTDVDAGEPLVDTKVWIFGNRDMLLDVPVINGTLTLNSSQTKKLGVGTYHILFENAGPNTILETRLVQAANAYPSTTFHIESPFRGIDNIEIGGTQEYPGLASQILYEIFKNWIKQNTDDVITEMQFVVQTPSIEISSIDETEDSRGYFWQVRGYTNYANGTPLFAILDEGQQTARTLQGNTVFIFAEGDQPGYLRTFKAAIPINYNNTPVGAHFVTVRSTDGTFATVPRWIYEMPEGQEKPVSTTKYSGGNLFVPTPTPEIVKVPGPEVIKTVIVTITPSPTPTPVPTPWYFKTPWFYIEIFVTIIATVLFGLWIMWKLGMI